jgi:hypothetical protein
MKLLLAPILVLLMLTQTFSKWVIVAEYQLNKEYIAKNLCINKAKPRLHCNGKCQMMKKLAEEEKENSSSTTTKHFKINIQQVVFCDEIFLPSVEGIACNNTLHRSTYRFYITSSPLSSVFHPPAVA